MARGPHGGRGLWLTLIVGQCSLGVNIVRRDDCPEFVHAVLFGWFWFHLPPFLDLGGECIRAQKTRPTPLAMGWVWSAIFWEIKYARLRYHVANPGANSIREPSARFGRCEALDGGEAFGSPSGASGCTGASRTSTGLCGALRTPKRASHVDSSTVDVIVSPWARCTAIAARCVGPSNTPEGWKSRSVLAYSRCHTHK